VEDEADAAIETDPMTWSLFRACAAAGVCIIAGERAWLSIGIYSAPACPLTFRGVRR